MTIAGGHGDIKFGTKWIGTDGWVWVDRGGIRRSNEEWKDIKELPDDQVKIKLHRSTNHYRNFIDSREVAPADHFAGDESISRRNEFPG